MSWARLDDSFWRNPKILRLPFAERGLLVTLWSYSADNATDGLVPREAVRSIVGDLRTARYLLANLEQNGNLTWSNEACYLHDFLDYNFSKAQVDAKRAKDRARKFPRGIHAESTRNRDGIASDSSTPDPKDLELRSGTDLRTALDTYTADEEPPVAQEEDEDGVPRDGVPRDEFGRVDLRDLDAVLTATQAHAFRKIVAQEPRWLDVAPGQIERLRAESNGSGSKALTEALISLTYDPTVTTSPAAKLDAVFGEKLAQVLEVQAAKSQPLEETGS